MSSAFMTYFINESKQTQNMRLIAITLQRKLHRKGWIDVTEQPQKGRIVVETYGKSTADQAQDFLDKNGIEWD